MRRANYSLACLYSIFAAVDFAVHEGFVKMKQVRLLLLSFFGFLATTSKFFGPRTPRASSTTPSGIYWAATGNGFTAN